MSHLINLVSHAGPGQAEDPTKGPPRDLVYDPPPPSTFLISGWGSNVATATLVKVEKKKRKEEEKRK
jgi:hypothetical protein